MRKLPTDVTEAFQSDATALLALGPEDLAHFKGCVDRSGRNWSTPRPSARLLRLVRRMALTKSPWGEKGTADTLVVLLDLSQLPKAWAPKPGEAPRVLTHLGHLVGDVLARMKVKPRTFRMAGGCLSFVLDGKSVATVRSLVEAHAAYVGDGPALATKPDSSWKLLAADALARFEAEVGAVRPGGKKAAPAKPGKAKAPATK